MRELYSYWRSSTAYRVRIAMNLKKLSYELKPVSLPDYENQDEQFLSVNPQGLVPALVDGHLTVAQSMAILEYLEDISPDPPLLPEDREQRAYVRMLANIVACDIHPLNNVRVLRYLENQLSIAKSLKLKWYRHWISEGLRAFEATLNAYPWAATFCCGESVSLADVCLVPQVYNAMRFNCQLETYPTIRSIVARCEHIGAFAKAHPSAQIDAR